MSLVVPSLVGRENELSVLERALEDVAGGSSRIVVLQGEPGIGKSRLLAEAAAGAEERGMRVASGRAAELERDLTFALLVDALDPLFSAHRRAIAELEIEQQGELAAVFPAIGRLAEAGAAPASGERHRVARTLRLLLGRVAEEQALAVLLDDIQWADPASADVLALLLHRPPQGVLLALATRGGLSSQLGASLVAAEREGRVEVLELGPLPHELVEEILPDASRATREHLYRESGGNPFYLQELARMSRTGARGGAEARLAGVPRAVRAALAAELAALSPDVLRALEGAAVAGDPFEPELAARAADVEESVVLAALDALLASDLIRPTDDPRRFRFRHPLVRRAVYEGAGGGWRLGAHARAAEALAERGATAARRAHHVERAARPGDLAAIDVLAAAAEEVARMAPATAAGWYEAAIRLLPETPEHRPRRLELLRGRARALVLAGRASEAVAVLRQVLSVAPSEASAGRVEATVMLAGLLAVWTQQPEEATRVLTAEREALDEAAPALRAALNLEMAGERAEYGDHSASEALADHAAADARAAGDRPLEAAAAARAADAAHCRLRGDDPDALAAVDAKIAAAGELVDTLPDDKAAERLSMLLSLGIARTFTGRFEDARAAVERGLAIARTSGQGLFSPAFVCVRGFVDQELGRLDAAEADQEEALESALLSGNVQVAYWASIASSWIALARGSIDAALAHGLKAWELVGTRSYSQAGFSLADARLAAGDPQGALMALEAFEWVRPELWTLDRVKAAEIAVRVLLAHGRVDEAAEWARRAPFESGGRRSGVFGAIGAKAEAGALLAQGAAAESARIALTGAAEADRGLAPLWAARCRTLAGEALLADGHVDEARQVLRRAAADLEARGAWGYRDAALRALRRLGDRPRVASGAATREGGDRLAALSPREREVAQLVAEGRTNGQIAAQLHLSERTVEKHVSSVLAKLGLSSRTGVVTLLASERSPAR
ncbi:MAG TPA: BREX system ATP-binding domain-containing protein [Gaiella sp.]|nr:BREX system ATP-binding domain-containing protein [Gaiella sp.]